jgi:hypothetical protein
MLCWQPPLCWQPGKKLRLVTLQLCIECRPLAAIACALVVLGCSVVALHFLVSRTSDVFVSFMCDAISDSCRYIGSGEYIQMRCRRHTMAFGKVHTAEAVIWIVSVLCRYIGSGEYIQMSGRAGRRGKDDHGTVIVCVDETLDLETCKGIVQVRYVLHCMMLCLWFVVSWAG